MLSKEFHATLVNQRNSCPLQHYQIDQDKMQESLRQMSKVEKYDVMLSNHLWKDMHKNMKRFIIYGLTCTLSHRPASWHKVSMTWQRGLPVWKPKIPWIWFLVSLNSVLAQCRYTYNGKRYNDVSQGLSKVPVWFISFW